MAIIGGDQGKAGESKGSGRKADDLRLSCLCLLLLVSLFYEERKGITKISGKISSELHSSSSLKLTNLWSLLRKKKSRKILNNSGIKKHKNLD